MLALLICTASFIFSKACLYGTSLKEGLFAPRMCPLFLKITSQKITKESLISIWITLHVFSCHLFIYSYPCGFHTRKVVGSSPARNIFDHKLNFSFVILFSWEPYPVWVCKKHLPVRESVRPTNDRTAIDGCWSVLFKYNLSSWISSPFYNCRNCCVCTSKHPHRKSFIYVLTIWP